MSVGRLKNLNLLIEFSNSIFIKSLLCFFYFKLFICFPDVKRLRFFRGFTPWTATSPHTAQKMKLSIKDFLSKCDQIRRKLRIWSHLLEKSLKENFIFFVHCQRWTYCRACNISRPSLTFYNIRKLNRCSKTDISKSAWINVSLSENFANIPNE